MGKRRPPAQLLPHLARHETPMAAAWNAVGLLATALTGAGIVHVLTYHVPIGLPLGPRWAAAALALLAHCPLAGPLGLIAAIALAAPLLACWELRRLDQLMTTLTHLLRARHVALPRTCASIPRSPRRLLGLFIVVLALQASLLQLAGWIDPMQTSMVMNGRLMTMAATPVLPIGLLYLVVAALLALLLWRVEHRLIQVHAEMARHLRLLAVLYAHRTNPLTRSRPTCLPLVWAGLTLFARPRHTPCSRTGSIPLASRLLTAQRQSACCSACLLADMSGTAERISSRAPAVLDLRSCRGTRP